MLWSATKTDENVPLVGITTRYNVRNQLEEQFRHEVLLGMAGYIEGYKLWVSPTALAVVWACEHLQLCIYGKLLAVYDCTTTTHLSCRSTKTQVLSLRRELNDGLLGGNHTKSQSSTE